MSLAAARDLLRLLTDAYPPPESKAHSLTLEGDKLVLLLWHDETWLGGLCGGQLPLRFGPTDFELELPALLDEVRKAIQQLGGPDRPEAGP